MLPSAPALLSTSTGCPTALDKPVATMRARMSVTLPAANGTTKVIGRDGHGSDCANPEAGAIANARKAAAQNACRWERRVMGRSRPAQAEGLLDRIVPPRAGPRPGRTAP